MIKLTQLANYFEEGLNAALNNPEIKFKIWADAGEMKKALRNGNTITQYINGNLRTTTSANDANDLVMGVNGLSLEFGVPVKILRTNANQTSEQLNEIEDGQYPFIAYIISAINNYFSTAGVVALKDDNDTEFSISWLAGSTITGDVDIRSGLGKSILFTVYLEITFVEGGVISKSIKIEIDGSPVPIKAVRHGRSPVIERDVYAGNLISKNVITSTAFSVDIEFPANNDLATQSCIDYLFSGEPNVAHFVNIKFGNIQESLHLMTLNTVQTAVQGTAVAGITASLIEVTENIDGLNVPESFEIGQFMFSSTLATSISFDPRTNGTAYIAGKFYDIPSNVHTMSVPVEAKDYVYDEETNRYYIYVIANKNRIFTGNPNYSVVKAAENGE